MKTAACCHSLGTGRGTGLCLGWVRWAQPHSGPRGGRSSGPAWETGVVVCGFGKRRGRMSSWWEGGQKAAQEELRPGWVLKGE